MKIKVLKKMIEYFGGDVRRINHALKVYDFAQIISSEELIDRKTTDIIIYSAILHDIGIKVAEQKHNSSVGKYQEIEGPPIAREILSDLKISKEIINRVCEIVGSHHSYTKIDGIDFQIVVEADLMVNIFEEYMSRETIENINNQIFKTQTGKKLIKTMYS